MPSTNSKTTAVSTTGALVAIKDAAVKDAVSRSPIIKPAKKTAKGKPRKAAKPRVTKAAMAPKTPRVTKTAKLIAMLQRPEGADSDQIQKAFDWQPRTVRGAIAGALKKRLGPKATTERVEGRGTIYRTVFGADLGKVPQLVVG